jgi:hypothetical protein
MRQKRPFLTEATKLKSGHSQASFDVAARK